MSKYFQREIKDDHFPTHPSQIKYKTFFTNCIKQTLQYRGYKQTDNDDWNIYWCQKQLLLQTLDKIKIFTNKKINHFRNWQEICRKDLLAKNIKKFKKLLEKQGLQEQANSYDYTPLTYNLPTQYPIFFEQFKKANSKTIWIMKPIGKSQGKGIFLFNKITDIEEWSQLSHQPQPYIVQRYIHNPLVIGNKKFDMRLYALVTSHNPLTVYIYRSGFGRFTHSRYQLQDITALQSHITNVAIQKNSDNYDQQRGGKYFIDKLRLYLTSKYGKQKTDSCFYQVQQLMIKTLISTSKLMINDKKCFQLYGYDVMIDSNFKPWLIEINGSPSMSANTHKDSELKKGLLDDVFTILNMEGILMGDQKQIGGFDLVYKDNKRLQPNFADFMSSLNTYLKLPKQYSMIGCLNNRHQNIKKLAKLRSLKLTQQHQKKHQNSKNNQQTLTSSNTCCKNTRNTSINNKFSSNTNTRRGKSVAIANNQAKAIQTVHSIKNVSDNTTTSNTNQVKIFGISTKKTFNINSHDDNFKLPKVIPSNTNLNVNNIQRTGSRQQSKN